MSPLATAAAAGSHDPASPFADADVCREAGLALPPGAAWPSSRTTSETSPM